MLRKIEGAAVLLLLSVFFAYVLAPLVQAVQRRVRWRRRNRPISRGTALIIIYVALFVPGSMLWRGSEEKISRWITVTAPALVDHLFGRREDDALDQTLGRLPVPDSANLAAVRYARPAIDYLEREARATLGDLIGAAQYAEWLAVAPVLAFLLLTGAPGFQRSALRSLPRGHLQWRGEEYFRDVNSALAGYIRAQTAAAVIVGAACIGGFTVLGVAAPVSAGILAGILELVPAIGPFAALLMAVAQSGDRALAVIVFLVVLRIVQDYVIYPKLIRQGMHLPTTAVIATVWAGAVLAGAAGVILAIPVAGLLAVSMRHWREFRDIELLVRTHGRQ